MKAPVGLLSGSAVCDSRWRGFAPTSATPTRSLRKCRRIEEVKSRMDRKFSRIENLWPRDGSCPPLLRSKRIDRVCEAQRSNESPSGAFKRQNGLRQQMEGPRPDKFYKCFRIVKTQKISRDCAAHVMGSPVALNEVPAPVCAAALTESRYHVRSAHKIFKVRFPQKENTAHAAQR